MYPLKFKPLYKERIWGGDKLRTVLHKRNMPAGKVIGESWELSGLSGDESVVSNGMLRGNTLSELIEVYMGELVGEQVYERFGLEFPLLIKFIDAAQNLSIQVHPGDEVALARHNAYGKAEMWYVVDRESKAEILLGFERSVSRDEYLQAVQDNRLDALLTHFAVEPGQAFYIPSGSVHAICRGVMVAEIQQTSDITYRISDWGRVDKNGKSRDLHTDLAVDVIDYSGHPASYYRFDNPLSSSSESSAELISCQYFDTRTTVVDGCAVVRDYSLLDSFVVYVCVSGAISIRVNDAQLGDQPTDQIVELKCGEVALIPAVVEQVELTGHGTLLEVSC